MIIAHGELAARARAVVRGITVGVLAGGVLAAPLLGVLGLVLLFAPVSAGWRGVAPVLIVVAPLWLMVAIFGAHAHATPASGADKDGIIP